MFRLHFWLNWIKKCRIRFCTSICIDAISVAVVIYFLLLYFYNILGWMINECSAHVLLFIDNFLRYTNIVHIHNKILSNFKSTNNKNVFLAMIFIDKLSWIFIYFKTKIIITIEFSKINILFFLFLFRYLRSNINCTLCRSFRWN